MLRPGRIASPALARAFTFELSPPESPREGVEYNLAGKSANSRGRTYTGQTSSLMGCEQGAQKTRGRTSACLGDLCVALLLVAGCTCAVADCGRAVTPNIALVVGYNVAYVDVGWGRANLTVGPAVPCVYLEFSRLATYCLACASKAAA